MIEEYATVLSHCEKSASLEIELIHEAVEGWIKTSTGHDWEEDAEYVEFITADGGSKVFLKHYPVYQITEIAPIASGIKIRNTSTDSRNANVSVDSDSLDLAVDSGVNVMTASEAFSTYTTLATLIAQINAEAKGWDAVIYDTDYNSHPSATLMEIKNFFCGARRGVPPPYRNLKMLDVPYDDYACEEDTGIVNRSGGWASGFQQVVAKYSAYHAVPEEIKGAVRDGVKFLVIRHEDDTEGLKQYGTADLSVSFDDIMPGFVLDVVARHSKVM